jgi:hypothetical protein
LSISGSFNAVLEQTNSKLPGKASHTPRIFFGILASLPKTSRENTRFFIDCQAFAMTQFGTSSRFTQPDSPLHTEHSVNVLGLINGETSVAFFAAGLLFSPWN